MSVPTPRRVIPLVAEVGSVAGHRLVLLSLEVYGDWMDLRFARIDERAERPLPRRVPPPEAWSVTGASGRLYVVEDAVGRGDRAFSNGEVRLWPAVPDDGDTLHVSVTLLDGSPAITTSVEVPPASAT